ncbi:MAG TPA: hypothetical protein PK071_06120, partial [Atopobiaceae bacterium]|nr:hypothetical protein [Atopobiaceae bacterium]
MDGMRTVLRIVRRTLRASRLERLICCALGALIAVGECVVLGLGLLANKVVLAPKLGDVVCAVLAGTPQPPPSPDVLTVVQGLDIPFGWLALMLVPMHLVSVVYPDGRELQSVMVASGSRRACWEGISLSILASMLAYWAGVAAVCLIATLALGGELTFDTSTWLTSICGFARETLTHGSVRSGLPVCIHARRVVRHGPRAVRPLGRTRQKRCIHPGCSLGLRVALRDAPPPHGQPHDGLAQRGVRGPGPDRDRVRRIRTGHRAMGIRRAVRDRLACGGGRRGNDRLHKGRAEGGSGMSYLDVRQISKQIRDDVILDGISLACELGEVVGLEG